MKQTVYAHLECVPFATWQECPPNIVQHHGSSSTVISSDTQQSSSRSRTGSFLEATPPPAKRHVTSQNHLDEQDDKGMEALDDEMELEDGINDVDMCAESLEGDPRLTCVVMLDQEWFALCKESNCIIRPFRTKDDSLLVLVRSTEGYDLVGRVVIRCIEQLAKMPSDSDPKWNQVYSRQCLRSFRGNKLLWAWSFSDIDVFSEACRVWWVPSRHPNRTFKLARSLLSPGPASKGPASLSLAETAEFFIHRCTPEQQHLLADQVKNLMGKTIRLGTTCSGSDIVVAVMKQLATFFGGCEAPLPDSSAQTHTRA